MRWVLPLLMLCSCTVVQFGPEEIRDCEERLAFWLDEDGDGIGDPGTVYVGCEAPEGYVEVPPSEPLDTGDTGA